MDTGDQPEPDRRACTAGQAGGRWPTAAQPEILGKPMDDDKPKQQASLAKALNDLLFGAGGPAAEKYKNSPLADQTK